jgi:hypothetical protein
MAIFELEEREREGGEVRFDFADRATSWVMLVGERERCEN